MPIRSYLTIPALIGALLGAGVAAHAQTAPGADRNPYASPLPAGATATRHHRGSRMSRALSGLGLSEDQKAQIKAARQSYRTSRSSATPETRAQLRERIESALTPSQRARFDAAMQRKSRSQTLPVTPQS